MLDVQDIEYIYMGYVTDGPTRPRSNNQSNNTHHVQHSIVLKAENTYASVVKTEVLLLPPLNRKHPSLFFGQMFTLESLVMQAKQLQSLLSVKRLAFLPPLVIPCQRKWGEGAQNLRDVQEDEGCEHCPGDI